MNDCVERAHVRFGRMTRLPPALRVAPFLEARRDDRAVQHNSQVTPAHCNDVTVKMPEHVRSGRWKRRLIRDVRVK